MWLDYENYEDTQTSEVASRPRAAYVERIYPRADFNLLGLPTDLVGADRGQDLGF